MNRENHDDDDHDSDPRHGVVSHFLKFQLRVQTDPKAHTSGIRSSAGFFRQRSLIAAL